MDFYNEQWLCEHMCSVSIRMSVNSHMGCFKMKFKHFESTWESGTLPLIIVDIVSFTGIQWYLSWDGTLKYFKYFLNNFCLWMIGLSYCEIMGQRLACNTCVSNLFNSFWVYRPRLFSSQLLLQLWINSCVWTFYRIALFIGFWLGRFTVKAINTADEFILLHWCTAIVLMLCHCYLVNYRVNWMVLLC